MKVTYEDHMGTDLCVVNAARVSHGKRSEWVWLKGDGEVLENPECWSLSQKENHCTRTLSKRDQGIIQYLASGLTTKEREAHIQRGLNCKTPEDMERFINDTRRIATHFAPFTKTAIKLHISCPLFVAAQLFKHQVGFETPSSISYRYVEAEEFYMPDVWRKRADNVKQGSSDESVDVSWYDRDDGYNDWPTDAYEIALESYQKMLKLGVAPEQARMVLPQSTITEFIWQGNVAAWARLYNQRTDSHAQKETQDLAKQIGKIIQPLYPVSWEALTA